MPTATLLVLAVASVALLYPARAHAGGTVTITGRGWGHGIGMSLYGAYGRALAGYNAKQILTHYYSGVQVRRVSLPRRVRVGLLQNKGRVEVTSVPRSDHAGRIVFKVAGRGRIASGSPDASWVVEPSDTGGMRLLKNGRKVKRAGRTVFGSPSRPLKLVYSKFGTLARLPQKSLSYAYGRMFFSTHAPASCGEPFCMRAVLALGMQKYIYGLGEVPASWPQAALRAQAIAGRTYAYRSIESSGQHRTPCDCALYDSSIDQVYSGDAKRTGSGRYWNHWKRAVKRTRNMVILYHGDPIEALYSSSSGGHTENNENVWGGAPIPYLRGVRDRADRVSANPNYRWTRAMGLRDFARRLRSAYGIGSFKRIKLLRPFGVSGRVTVVKGPRRGGARVAGRRRTVRVSGWSLRSVLDLNDTWFRIRVDYDVAAAFGPAYARAATGLGPPIARQQRVATPQGRGLMQRFARGSLYLAPSSDDVVALYGRLDSGYRRAGGPRSACGWPLGAPTQGVRAAGFEGGVASGRPAGAAVDCGPGRTPG
jgi:peptidoglycan hydrolase-like amidase